jgi:pilus assembly protein TadC
MLIEIKDDDIRGVLNQQVKKIVSELAYGAYSGAWDDIREAVNSQWKVMCDPLVAEAMASVDFPAMVREALQKKVDAQVAKLLKAKGD